MPLHPRMGRRMGMTAASSIVPLSGVSLNSKLTALPAAAAASSGPVSTPMMSRTSSEASTSSTCTSSSTSTTLTDDFRFEDDDEDEHDQEELDDEDLTDDEDVYTSSSSDATSSRGNGHSSCPSASSLDSFTLPRDCFPSSSSSLASFPIASSSSPSSSSSTSTKAQQKRIETPYTFPSPTPISELRASDLEATLRFSSILNGSIASSSEEESAPPAFFPLQRVSFAPQLKIKTQGGIPLAINSGNGKIREHGIAGMMLGVTGTVEILDAEKSRKTGR